VRRVEIGQALVLEIFFRRKRRAHWRLGRYGYGAGRLGNLSEELGVQNVRTIRASYPLDSDQTTE
jgi:hypothetical protein